ncbi:hypothetical protein D3C85_687660 [compost metagenome]
MRSEFHIDSVKTLVIQSCFLEEDLCETHAPPCCVSIVLDVLTRTILDWRLFNSSSLAQATALALDSMFDEASGADPRAPRLGHRYRHGSSEYEVTAVRDDCDRLRRTDSLYRDAVRFGAQATVRPQRKALPTCTSVTRAGAPAKVNEHRPNPLKRRWLDRQPEAFRQLILEEVSNHLSLRLSGRSQALHIAYQIAYWNESRPFNEQLQVPSFTTLRRLIRELREHSNIPS